MEEHSAAAYQRRTKQAASLIAGAYLAGTNTRRVRRALGAAFGGAISKDTVSRVWRKVKADWDAWNSRSLADEIDLASRVWTIPGERMKMGRVHRVPLSGRAAEILQSLPRRDPYIFPGRNSAFGPSMMWKLLREKMGMPVTVHGFRSSFADWAAEQTDFPSEVREMALAHAVSDRVEAAYRRGDLFDKRRQLAEEWAGFCAGGPAEALRTG